MDALNHRDFAMRQIRRGDDAAATTLRDSIQVNLFAEAGEPYVLAKGEGRQAKEMAIRRKRGHVSGLSRQTQEIAGVTAEVVRLGR